MPFIVPELDEYNQADLCQIEYNWDLFTGCTKKSAGCKNCYAEQKLKAIGLPFDIKFHSDALEIPWSSFECQSIDAVKYFFPALAEKVPTGCPKVNIPTTIRVCLSSDFFHTDILCCDPKIYEDDPRGFPDLWIYKMVHNTIKRHPKYEFSFLTKRPENMAWVLEYLWENDIPENTNFGVSIEDQATADERLPILFGLNVPKRVIGVSPMLEQVDLNLEPGLVSDIYCSGEYAKDPRPFDTAWAADLLEQCKKAGTDFHCFGPGTHFFNCEECDPERYCQNPSLDRQCAA